MKKFIFILCAILASSLIFSLVFKNYLFESLIHYSLKKSGLHSKFYTFKEATLDFFPLQITIKSPRYEYGVKGNAYWTFDSDSLQILIQPKSLLSHKFLFKSITVDGLNVVLSEVLPIIKKKNKKNLNLSKYPFHINKLLVKNSKFTYIDSDRKNKRQLGLIEIKNINVYSENISSNTLTKTSQKFFANGSLEGSKIRLDLDLNLSSKPKVEMDLEVKNQDVSAFNPYVQPIEHIKLSGQVITAIAKAKMNNRNLKVQTKIKYKDFNIKVQKKENRNLFKTVLSQWVVNMKTCSNRTGKERPVITEEIQIVKKDEPWVYFILQGLLKSTLKQACL